MLVALLLGAPVVLDELLDGLVGREAAVDVALGVGRDAFRHLGGPAVVDEGDHLAVLDATDPDALLEEQLTGELLFDDGDLEISGDNLEA